MSKRAREFEASVRTEDITPSNRSTIQQTGEMYTNGFELGFIAQNSEILQNGQLQIGVRVHSSLSRTRRSKELGDIDFLCQVSPFETYFLILVLRILTNSFRQILIF